MPIIHGFRRDLCLTDNTALAAAIAKRGGEVVPVFVLDDGILHGKDVAPARVQFLLDSLSELDRRLRTHGKNYPPPIVDHLRQRDEVRRRFKEIRS